MQLGRSLTRTTQIAIAATVLPGLVALYLFSRDMALNVIGRSLVREMVAVMMPFLQSLQRVERSVTTLADVLAERLAEPPDDDEITAFDAMVSRDEHGVIRNRRERFDGTRQAGVFIPADVPLSDELKRRKWRAMRVISSYGRAALQHVDGVWFDQLDKTSVIFWRRDPHFIYTLPPDHDYTQTLWDQLASPRMNAERKPLWTPAILETTVGTWVVSCVAPLDRDGHWQGIVGHDIALSDLIGTFHGTEFYPGTHHFLLDLDPNKDGHVSGEGSYILAGPWQQALEAKSGDFKPDLSNEPALWDTLWRNAGPTLEVGTGLAVHERDGRLPIVTMAGESYLAIVADIAPLNWRYAELVPVTAVLAPIYRALAMLSGLIVLTALTVALFMRSSVRRRIVEPLDQVIATVRAYGRGEVGARTKLRDADEISQLGQTFDHMADNVEGTLQALRESESRYRSVVENVREVVFQCDAHMRLQFLSKAWQTLAGRPPVGGIGHLLTDYLHPDDVRRKREDFATMCANNATSCFGSYRLLRPDGEIRWVEISLQQVARTDSGCICIGSIDDITERLQAQKNMLRLQEQLRQSQKMEALGRLTGGVAHDYNNILAIMLGYTEMAMDQDVERHGGALKPMLERVMQAGERGRDLVSKMLTFSRRKVGVPVATNAALLVEEAGAMLRAAIPPSIELKTEIDPDVDSVMVDPTGFYQLLMNLVINARDAMPEGGHVVIRVRAEAGYAGDCTACHADVTGRYVAVEVEDDGAGIPPGVLPNIFDPFFTTKDIGRGTGMGLSVVHGIVHESNGHIIVDSQPGAGTTVRLLLRRPPANVETAAPAPAATAKPHARQDARVLVVDDETALTRLWERALTRHGFQVESYNDSRMAIDAFRANPSRYDVAILDQAMPGTSGETLARELLAARRDMRVILCTGYSENIDATIAAAIGVRRFLMKPISIAAMVDTLNDVLAEGGDATSN